MPNWCENRLDIQGNKEDIAIIAKRCGCDQGQFSFNGIIPMPEELAIESGSRGTNGHAALYGDWQQVVSWLGSKRTLDALRLHQPTTREEFLEMVREHPKDFDHVLSLELGAQVQSNLLAYGHETWYEWCIDRWGTKWDARLEEDSLVVEENAISVRFDTAWRPPLSFVKELCKQFPRVHVHLDYLETGAWFAGSFDSDEEEEVDLAGSDVKAFAERVFGTEFTEE